MALPNVRGNRTGNRPVWAQANFSSACSTSSSPISSRPGSGRLACGSPVRPAHRTRWIGAVRGRSPARGRGGAEEHDRRRAERGREVRDPGVAAHDAARDGDRRRQLAHGRAARQHVGVVEPGRGGDPPRARPRSSAPPVTTTRRPRRARRRSTRRPALRRPAARPRRGARDGRSWRRGVRGGGRGRGSIDREVGRIGVDPGRCQQPAPPRDLVLVLVPGRAVVAVAREGDQSPRLQVGEHGVALGPAAVQVDGEARARCLGRERHGARCGRRADRGPRSRAAPRSARARRASGAVGVRAPRARARAAQGQR